MTISDDSYPSSADWNKRGGLEEVDKLKIIRSTAWDEHTHLFRWLMASLLGINGAACLVVVGLDGIPMEYRIWACGAYVIGILFALLVAVFGQRSIRNSLASLQKYIGYWMSVAEDGERDEDFEQLLKDELKAAEKIALGSRIVGCMSVLAFLGGIMISGIGLQKETAPAPSDGYDQGGAQPNDP